MQATLDTKTDEKKSQAGPDSFSQSKKSLEGELGAPAGMPLFMQPKLAVNQPDDPYEQEADRMEERVVTASSFPAVQRKCVSCETGGSLCSECEKESRIQRKAEHPISETGTFVPESYLAKMGSGRPLDDSSRRFMESRFGHSLEHVRIHTDAQAVSAAQALHALAFTVGRNIVFGGGQYSPHSEEGRRLLAHELTHTLQQPHGGAGLAPRARLRIGDPSDEAEREAERVARLVTEESAGAPSRMSICTAPLGLARDEQPGASPTTDNPAATGTPAAGPLADPTAPEPFEGARKLSARSTALNGEIAAAQKKWGEAITKQDLPWKDLIALKLNIATLMRERLLVDTYFGNAFFFTKKLEEPAEDIIKKCHDAAPDEEQTLRLVEGLPAPPGTVSPIVSDLLLKQPELFPDHVVGLYRSAVEEFRGKSKEEAKRAAALLTPFVSRPIEEIIPVFVWMIEHEDALEALSTQVGFITTLNQEAPVLLEKKDPNSTSLGIDDIRLKVNEERVNVGTLLNPLLGEKLGGLYPILEAYYFFAFYDGLAAQMDLFRIAVESSYERLNEPFSSPDVIKDLERTYNSTISFGADASGIISISQLAPEGMREGYRWIARQFENVLDPWVAALSWFMRIWEGFGLYDVAGEMGRALKALISPQAILTMVGFVALVIALQFVPFGNLIADAIMIALLGKDVLEGLVILGMYFDAAADATTFRGLYRAAQKLQGAGSVAVSLLLQLALLAAGKALGSYLKYRRGMKIKEIDDIADDPAIKDGPPSVQKALAEARKGTEDFSGWKDTLDPDTKATLDDPANAGLRKTWAEMDPAVRRILTRCGSSCIPRSATPAQAAQIKAVLNRFGISGGELEALLKEYFHARRDILQGAIDDVSRAPTVEALEAVARENPIVPPGASAPLAARINVFFGKFKLSPDEAALLREYFQVRSGDLEAALADVEGISVQNQLMARLRRAATERAPAAPGTPEVPRGRSAYSHAIAEHGSQIDPGHMGNRARTKPDRATGAVGLQQGQWYNNQLIVEIDRAFPRDGIGTAVDVNVGRPIGRVYLPDGLVISDVTWVRIIRNPDGSLLNAFPVLPPGVTY